jgi:hypothetical protein
MSAAPGQSVLETAATGGRTPNATYPRLQVSIWIPSGGSTRR